MRKKPHGSEYAQEPSVKRHAALPQCDNLQRMPNKIGGLVKNDIAQTPAEYHAERTIEQRIVNIRYFPATFGVMADTPFAQAKHAHKTDKVHEAIPMNA